MKSIAKSFMIVLAMFAMTMVSSAPAFSQGRGRGQGRAGGGMMSDEQFQENLKQVIVGLEIEGDVAESVTKILTAEQTKRVEMIAAARESGDMRTAMGQMREKMQAMETETMTELAKVLTEDQVEKYKKIRMEQMPQRRRGQGLSPR